MKAAPKRTLLPKESVHSLFDVTLCLSWHKTAAYSFRQEDSRDNACRADHIVVKRQNFFFVELDNKSMRDVKVTICSSTLAVYYELATHKKVLNRVSNKWLIKSNHADSKIRKYKWQVGFYLPSQESDPSSATTFTCRESDLHCARRRQ